MGSHASADDILRGVEADAIRARAGMLARTMTEWLSEPTWEHYSPMNNDQLTSDLVEWCRSARDVLEAISRG